MCGRYTQLRSWPDLVALYGIAESLSPSNFPVRYNIAPTQQVAAVRRRADTGDRALVTLRWGLVPSWAKQIDIGARLINARAETVHEKPAFRDAFRKRRCLIVADGFYEWQAQPAGPKQPWLVTVADGRPFAFAGLWEEWWDAGNTLIESCAIVTTAANAALTPIHDRMPAILTAERFDAWLDPAAQPAALRALLVPYPGAMTARPVGRRINDVRNDDPGCIEPVGAA
ncbi:MAG: SOS response-associated peptidase [Rhodospirillales bacterium]